MAETVIQVNDLVKKFPLSTTLRSRLFGDRDHIHAIDGISFELKKGEIFGLAGESGCGKTTTARCISRLEDPTSGEILFNGDDIADASGAELRNFYRDIQMTFQDPFSSINDRFTIKNWVDEPLRIHGIGTREEKDEKVIRTLEQCGLTPADSYLDQFPHELSGGQRQRVALARALVLDPDVIIADEPTSMLDVSLRASILRVLKRFVEDFDVTILYISHDIALLRYICDRIGIMYRGQLAEEGSVESVLTDPKHPYTQALMRSVPRLHGTSERERVEIPPGVEDNVGGIEGCPFQRRCEYSFDMCDQPVPMQSVGEDHEVACHLYDDDIDRKLPQL